MNDDAPDVLGEMARRWKATPPPGVKGDTYGRNHTITAAEIRSALSSVGDDSLRHEVLGFLDRMCDLYQADRVPDRSDHFVGDCALAMIAGEGGVTAPLGLVQRIVRLFPPAVWYSPIRELVGRYLTVTQLVDTLSSGVINPAHPGAQQDALTAFRLYLDRAQPDSDPARGTVERLAMKKIQELTNSSDPEIARLAQNAARVLHSVANR